MTDGLYIGLMSGTSRDGVDAALAHISPNSIQLLATHSENYPASLRARLSEVVEHAETCTVDDVGQLDHWVGEIFRDAANSLLAQTNRSAGDVVAIGSHGQTLRHQPAGRYPFTLQIGNPAIIAAGTGITTVADFRRADMAHGGQGAPLAPAFHDWVFHSTGEARVVVNIGGIANISVLAADASPVQGFDTGPGNTLMDGWTRQHLQESYDEDGRWASTGTPDESLLGLALADPYFGKPGPKSTGPEYFNQHWLQSLDVAALPPADVQATLCELTAQTIATAIRTQATTASAVLVCGGGVHNRELMRRLGVQLAGIDVTSTEHAGLHPDWVEAAAFAWFAHKALAGEPLNLSAVTGASRPSVLGGIYSAASLKT